MEDEYTYKFVEASNRTCRLDLSVPDSANAAIVEPMLDEKTTLAIADEFIARFKEWNNESFVGQCLKSHLIFQPLLEKIIQQPVTYTIGYIKGDDQTYFEFSEQDAMNWVTEGIPENNTKLHSWLTLPSTEIIDLTFLPTYAKMTKTSVPKGALIADYSNNLDGLKYIPMILGSEFLTKIGAAKLELVLE